jgi:hypothetical protein
MLTDDDLTLELEAAVRSGTADLAYNGRRRPRRIAPVAVPLAAATVAITAVAISVTTSGPAPAPTAAPTAAPTGTSTGTAPTATGTPMVTDTIRLAGFTLTYQHARGETAPLYATMDASLPDGVTAVSAPDGVQAWVGKDPVHGGNALWVKAPTRNDGRLFALHSDSWTTDQLVDLFHHGSPRTVPLVED